MAYMVRLNAQDVVCGPARSGQATHKIWYIEAASLSFFHPIERESLMDQFRKQPSAEVRALDGRQ